MRHPLAEKWEARLEAVLQDVDHELEERFGTLYDLHPARPEHGEAANRRYDGLFRITANFTAGFGSESGPGYVLEIGLSTLERVSDKDRQAIEAAAVGLIRDRLPGAFPGRDLRLIREGTVWKLVGDLSLQSSEDRS